MCRFVYYQGPPIHVSALLTEPEHSLIRQSVHARLREEPLNGDGFGVAWYRPMGVAGGEAAPGEEVPASRYLGRFRSITPAWSNRNLEELATVIRSPRILAHVRAASPGSIVNEVNTHPFRREGLVFMHNGDIGGFGRMRRALRERLSDAAYDRILGSTDSEHFFALVQDELDGADPGSGGNGPARMAEAFRRALEAILELRAALVADRHVYLNVVLTDGRSTLVSRITTDRPERSQSLFLKRGGRYVCEDGVCRMLEEGGREGTILLSSEPLSSDDGWEAVPPGHLLLIDEEGTVRSDPV